MIGGEGDVKNISPIWEGTAKPGDLFDQPLGAMSRIRGKLADHVGDHVVLSPEGVVAVTSPGTKPSYPRPFQSLKHSMAFSASRGYVHVRIKLRNLGKVLRSQEYMGLVSLLLLVGSRERVGKGVPSLA